MRTYLILMLVAMAGLGCTQMRYAGRYQEVKIESEPPGAMVLIEGNIGPLSPVAVKAEDGTELAYSSPMQLKTPVVVILDKENPEYHIKIACEGYPEFEKVLKPRFAFHPYLIITFPVVPFWSKYEIQRFDDISVDFEAYQAELEAMALQDAQNAVREAEAAYKQKCDEIGGIQGHLEEMRKYLADAEERVSELEGKVKEAEEALEVAEEEEKEAAQKNLDQLNEELQEARNACEKLPEDIGKLEEALTSAEGEQLDAKSKLDAAEQKYSGMKKTEEKSEEEGEEEPENK